MQNRAYAESVIRELADRIDGNSTELPLRKGRFVQAPDKCEPNPMPIITWGDLHAGLLEDVEAD